MFRDKGSTPNDAGLDVRAEQNAGTLAGNEGKTIDLSPDPCQPATKEEVGRNSFGRCLFHCTRLTN